MSATELYTVDQAAKFLNVSRQFVYLKIWNGEIKPTKLLGKNGIPFYVLEQIKASREIEPTRDNGHK